MWLKSIGLGIVLYAVMFLAWSGMLAYGFVDGVLPRIFGLTVLTVTAIVAGRALRYASWKDILPHSMLWVAIVALLDIAFSVPFTGWQLFADWNVWVGYALVVLIPLLAPYTRRAPAHSDAQ